MANTFHEIKESDLIFQNGGIVLRTVSMVVGSSGATAGIKVGRGIQDVVVEITALNIGTDSFAFYVEANTSSDMTTWMKIAGLPGDGVIIDSPGKFVMTVKNPFDYEIRLSWVVTGGATVTFGSTIYPVI